MINTYTCTPDKASPQTYFEDLKTFFEDKWTWSNIETTYPDVSSKEYNNLTFWIDNNTYFKIIYDPTKSRYWVGCGEKTESSSTGADYVTFYSSQFDSVMIYQTSQGILLLFKTGENDYSLVGAIGKMTKLSDNTEITGFFSVNNNSGHQGSNVQSLYNQCSIGSSSSGGTNLVPQVDFSISLNSTVEGQYPAKTNGEYYVMFAQSDVFPADGTVVKFTMNGVSYVGNKNFVLADYPQGEV